MRRFTSNVRISWTSSTAFATLGTTLVTLIVLPVLHVMMNILLGADLATPELQRTGYAAALVAMISSIAGGIVSAVATDRNLGIFEQVHVLRRFDPAYWLAKAVVPTLLAVVTAAVVIGMVALWLGDVSWPMLTRTVALLPAALGLGVLLGIAAAGIGVALPDPYLGATILSPLLPLAAGVIVPVAYYPAWLIPLSIILPGAGIVGVLDAVTWRLASDLLLGLAWAITGLICTRIAIRQLRRGIRREAL